MNIIFTKIILLWYKNELKLYITYNIEYIMTEIKLKAWTLRAIKLKKAYLFFSVV